jgi:hypothetical protein
MEKHKFFLVALLALVLASCSFKTYREEQLVGRWFSNAWLQNGQPTELTAWFEFNEDKTYRAVIARRQEEGIWWMEGYKLYTRANGQEPIVVKVETLDEVNLEIAMNRGGQAELIIFNRAKEKQEEQEAE